MLFHPAPLCLQVKLQPARLTYAVTKQLQSAILQCEKLLAGHHQSDTVQNAQVKLLRKSILSRHQSLSGKLFKGAVQLSSPAILYEAVVRMVAQVVSGSESFSDDDNILCGGWQIKRIKAKQAKDIFFFPENDPKSGPDAICLGHNRHRGYQNMIAMETDDRMRHMCIMGQTGTGKSTLLEQLVVQDIRAGQGVCLIDPHGDLVEKVLRKYPASRKDDLVLLDILDEEYTIPLNFLSYKTPQERDFIKDAELLKYLYYPTFSEHDLANLPNYSTYVSMTAGSSKPMLFSLETIYEPGEDNSAHVAKLRAASNAKYGATNLRRDSS